MYKRQALARTLTDACEDGITAVLRRDVVDEFHDENCLADAGAAEQSDFTAARIRRDEVDDLDARFGNLRRRFLFVELRSRTVNRPELLIACLLYTSPSKQVLILGIPSKFSIAARILSSSEAISSACKPSRHISIRRHNSSSPAARRKATFAVVRPAQTESA